MQVVDSVTQATSSAPTAQATSTANASSQSSQSNPLDQLIQGNTFLNLLVAELEHQNPDNPVDPSQLLAETATLAEVETMTAMSSQQTTLEGLVSAGLVGKQVSYTDSGGKLESGTISGVSFGQNGPDLEIGGNSVPLSSLVSVGNTSSTSSSQSGTAGGSTSSSSNSSSSTSTTGTDAASSGQAAAGSASPTPTGSQSPTVA
jgi:flagellar basal-body rod modification protein FlgD